MLSGAIAMIINSTGREPGVIPNQEDVRRTSCRRKVETMYQQVTLIGNLGNDPELRYTASGDAVTNFSLAVNRRTAGSEGVPHYKTTWFRVTAWRRQAEVANQYLSKGRRVMVVGEIETIRTYMDRDDNPRAIVDLTAREIQFLDNRAASEEISAEAEEQIPE